MKGPLAIGAEAWREYDFCNRVYRISAPLQLWVGETTHRVLDSTGVVHCLPRPGYDGCVLRWMPKDVSHPVQF